MTIFLWNLAAYSLQLAALAAVTILTTSLLRFRAPRLSWRFWQVVMLAALLLPFAQPHREARLQSFFTFNASNATIATDAESLAVGGAGTWPLVIAFIIGAGILMRLLWLTIGLYRIRQIVASSQAAPSLLPLVDELSRSTGAHATVKISSAVEGPATVGVRAPIILLPPSVVDMPAAVQRAILCHELTHVKRRDWMHTIAEEAWCAVLWFHPAARLIASRVSLARETVVDEITILLTRDRRAYAEALLAFSDPQPHMIGVTPFIGRRTLSQRIALIAEEVSMSRRRVVATLVIALSTSAALTAAVVDRVPMSTASQGGIIYEPKPGSGVTLPQVLREVKPQYTKAAMQQKIQGTVWLSCVVGDTGDITDVTVSKSLDPEYGLDEEAVKAAWQWKFKPGQKDGKPVAVRITLELTFTLKK